MMFPSSHQSHKASFFFFLSFCVFYNKITHSTFDIQTIDFKFKLAHQEKKIRKKKQTQTTVCLQS